MAKNQNFANKLGSCQKIKILVKNKNLVKKSKSKNRNFGQK